MMVDWWNLEGLNNGVMVGGGCREMGMFLRPSVSSLIPQLTSLFGIDWDREEGEEDTSTVGKRDLEHRAVDDLPNRIF